MEKKLKKAAVNSVLFVCVVLLAAFTRTNEDVQVFDVQTAISSGKIIAKFNSNGTYSGESVDVSLTNNLNQRIRIRIPAGSIFSPSDDGEQDLISVEDQFIVLQPKARIEETISAYCKQASDRCPSEQGSFKLLKSTDVEMGKLLTYLKDHKVSSGTLQDAVWTVSDRHAVSNIQVSIPADQELRKYLSTVTGLKDTWYTTPQQRVVEDDGRIVHETVVVKGEIKFVSRKGAVVHQEIARKDGTLMFKGEKSNTMATTGNVDFQFTIRVKGWEKGEYQVRVMEGEKELISYPFAIGV